MKSMKIMLSAMLLSLSLGAYAQDDDELLGAAEEETTEVSEPTAITARRFFQRVQIGYTGMGAKYTDNSTTWAIPKYEKYYLSGIELGWIGDLRLNQKIPVFLELGAMFNYSTGKYNGYDYSKSNVRYNWHSRINAFTINIPVVISYQFRDVYKEGLTIAPFAGVYGRFNLVASRTEDRTTESYNIDINGNEVITAVDYSTQTKSLMKYVDDGGWMKGRSHVGNLFQAGIQVGANAFYKRYSFGFTYMYDLMPFAKHNSALGLSSKSTAQGGNIPSSGTGCDMKISTKHSFALTVGYLF